ncbi:MAG: M20/M25/M40 family metallo-hydrolase [Thermoanaerobaculia bacterium]
MMKRIAILFLFLFAAACAVAPEPEPVPSAETVAHVREILASPEIQEAFAHVDAHREEILAEWRMLTEIEAPSGEEAERADAVEAILRRSPSVTVSRDEVGNIIAVRRGTGEGPTVVVDAHLDTVFHEIENVETRIENGRLYGPGVGDDSRNMEAILAMLRALDAAGVETVGDLWLTFTVEEETSFRGIDHLLETRGDEMDYVIALDGGFGGFTYGGTGTYWSRLHFLGPGGHTRSRTPPYSAALPLARAIERIYDEVEVPSDPPSWLNVGMLGGTDVVNKKAEDAWFSADVRSIDQATLDRLDAQVQAIAREEAARAGMEIRVEEIDRWPAAQIPGHRTAPLVMTTQAVFGAMGFADPRITATASNHSSAALRRGISAISTGAAPCGDAHAPTEWCEIEPMYLGIKRLILNAVAMADVSR